MGCDEVAAFFAQTPNSELREPCSVSAPDGSSATLREDAAVLKARSMEAYRASHTADAMRLKREANALEVRADELEALELADTPLSRPTTAPSPPAHVERGQEVEVETKEGALSQRVSPRSPPTPPPTHAESLAHEASQVVNKLKIAHFASTVSSDIAALIRCLHEVSLSGILRCRTCIVVRGTCGKGDWREERYNQLKRFCVIRKPCSDELLFVESDYCSVCKLQFSPFICRADIVCRQ
eukprot:SAG11_NODE_336_length_10544_cov_9.794926_9_plen_240_part_00